MVKGMLVYSSGSALKQKDRAMIFGERVGKKTWRYLLSELSI